MLRKKRRKNEDPVVSHLLDNFFTASFSDLSLADYENLYDDKPSSYSKKRKKKNNNTETKCILIDEELYCGQVKKH